MCLLTLRLWLSLMCAVQLLNHVAAKISITYPTQGIVYPPKGPDTVEWTYGSNDPSNITIYLATYIDGTLSNNLRCLTWDTLSGSVYITMSETAPFGDSWKWMFYDTDQDIQLGSNQIATSADFSIKGSVISTSSTSSSSGPTHTSTHTSTPSTSDGKSGLSAGAAAGIAIIVTLAVVALCLLAGYFCFYRRQLRRNNIRIAQSTTAPGCEKSELHGEHGASGRFPKTDEGIKHSEFSRTMMNEIPPPAHHEVEGYSLTGQVSPPRDSTNHELYVGAHHEIQGSLQAGHYSNTLHNAAPRAISRKELPSTARHGMQYHDYMDPASTAIHREELPADSRPAVQGSQE